MKQVVDFCREMEEAEGSAKLPLGKDPKTLTTGNLRNWRQRESHLKPSQQSDEICPIHGNHLMSECTLLQQYIKEEKNSFSMRKGARKNNGKNKNHKKGNYNNKDTNMLFSNFLDSVGASKPTPKKRKHRAVTFDNKSKNFKFIKKL